MNWILPGEKGTKFLAAIFIAASCGVAFSQQRPGGSSANGIAEIVAKS
jgi:hypothetical protein